MADAKITQLTEATTMAAADLIPVVVDVATTAVTKKMTKANLTSEVSDGLTRILCGAFPSPNSYYTNVRAQYVLFRADAAITITRIHIHGPDSTPGAEMALDLKFADDVFAGGFANATVIDVCDTSSGVKTITSGFDDATVPSGKYIYWQFDSAPNTDWTDFYYEVYFTYD